MVRLVRRLSSAASWAAVCGADGAAELVERTEELSIAGAGFLPQQQQHARGSSFFRSDRFDLPLLLAAPKGHISVRVRWLCGTAVGDAAGAHFRARAQLDGARAGARAVDEPEGRRAVSAALLGPRCRAAAVRRRRARRGEARLPAGHARARGGGDAVPAERRGRPAQLGGRWRGARPAVPGAIAARRGPRHLDPRRGVAVGGQRSAPRRAPAACARRVRIVGKAKRGGGGAGARRRPPDLARRTRAATRAR